MTLQSGRYLVLLVLLVLALVVQSLNHGAGSHPTVSVAVVTVLMVAVFFVVFGQRRERFLLLCVTAAALLANWAHYLLPEQHHLLLALVHHAAVVLLCGCAVVAVLRTLFGQKQIRSDEVLGALCGYLIAGSAWASLYSMSELVFPGSFNVIPALETTFGDWHGRRALLDYFSLVTLTTMGYGDITPVRGPATAFAISEAVFGQFYIAVVVAQLVGIRLVQAMERRDNQPKRPDA